MRTGPARPAAPARGLRGQSSSIPPESRAGSDEGLCLRGNHAAWNAKSRRESPMVAMVPAGSQPHGCSHPLGAAPRPCGVPVLLLFPRATLFGGRAVEEMPPGTGKAATRDPAARGTRKEHQEIGSGSRLLLGWVLCLREGPVHGSELGWRFSQKPPELVWPSQDPSVCRAASGPLPPEITADPHRDVCGPSGVAFPPSTVPTPPPRPPVQLEQPPCCPVLCPRLALASIRLTPGPP